MGFKKVTFADLLEKDVYKDAVQKREQKRKKENVKRFSRDNSYKNRDFVNAYNFVSLGDIKNIKRDICRPGTLSGKIECSLKNLTILFIGGKKSVIEIINKKGRKIDHGCGFFLSDGSNYILPASSLKGTIRNVMEVITTSCIRNVKEKNWEPKEFMPCNSENKLCFACRLFGTTGDNDNKEIDDKVALEGRVYFKDALLDKKKAEIVSEAKVIKALGQPHSSFKNFYYEKDKKTIRGRKFYWHHQEKISAGKNYEGYYEKSIKAKSLEKFNTSIQFLKPLNSFKFEVRFKNLTSEELGVLLYSLELEEGMAHKFGQGKSLGLGSCEIKIDKVLFESPNKYASFTKAYNEVNYKPYIEECIKKYITDDRKEIKELKTILNKKNSIDFSKNSYPELKWFNENKHTVLPGILDW